MTRFAASLALVWLAATSVVVAAPTADTIRAALLLRMAKLVKWSPQAMQQDAFYICVDDDTIHQLLSQRLTLLRQKGNPAFSRVGDLPIKVEKWRNQSYCHLLYSHQLATNSAPYTLPIGPDLDFLRQGGVLALVYEKQKIRLYVNQQALGNLPVKISSEVLYRARVYPW